MFAPLKASAQAWLASPDLSEGVGIRAGNLELHPGVGAEAGYDSNFFRASKAEGVIDVYKFRVTPSLTLSTLGPIRRGAARSDVDFKAGAHASYFALVAADSANSDVAKRNNVSAGADASVDVFPQRKIGFNLFGAYVRSIEAEGNTDDIAGLGFNRDTVRGGAGIAWRPGGGLFEWRAGYAGTFHYFENANFRNLDNLQHEVSTRGRWRFLPRSALLFDTSYTFIRYTSSQSPQPSGDALRSRIGFHGLVTYHLALLGMVGWATSFYQPSNRALAPRQYDSLIANAEARWFLQSRPSLDSTTITSGISSVAVGYSRSFSNSYYGSFYQRDRGYLEFDMFVVGAVAAGLGFGVSRIAFPQVIDADGTDHEPFAQARIDGRMFAEYRITETFGVNATLLYDQINSPLPPVAIEDLNYSRWQAYVGARLFW